MSVFQRLFNNIINNGITTGIKKPEEKRLVIANAMWLIALAGYLVFFIVIYLSATEHLTSLWVANLVMLGGFASCTWLMHANKHFLSKVMLLCCIYEGIFFYDSYCGTEAGVYFYYFTFLIISPALFSWKEGKVVLAIMTVATAGLFFLAYFKMLPLANHQHIKSSLIQNLYYFNFVFSFLLIAICSLYALFINNKGEKENRQNEINLQTLIDNTADSIWSIDNEYRILSFNKPFEKVVLDFSKKQLYPGFSLHNELFHLPNYSPYLKEVYKRVLSGESVSGEFLSNNTDFEIMGTPLRDIDGKITGGTFFDRNITEQKKRQAAMVQMGLNLQNLIDNTTGNIWSVDSNYCITSFNTACRQTILKHYNREIYNGFNVKDLFHLPNHPAVFAHYYERALSGETFGEEFSSNDKYYEVLAKPLHDINGAIIGATFYDRDITDRKIKEKEITQMGLNLQSLIDNTSGSIWCIDANCVILASNKKYKADLRKIFDVDASAGFDIKALFNKPSYPDKWRKHYEKVLKGEDVFEVYEFEDRLLELRAMPIFSTDGKVTGAALHTADVTEINQYNKELIAAKEKAEEASKTKARFLSNMSHELRTPLNGVIGIINVMLSENYLPSQKQNLDIVKYSGDHMLSLINDILDYNKIEEGKIEIEKSPFNLAALADKTAIFFNTEVKQKNIDFKINIDEMVNRDVVGDVTRLRQILNNLLSNAIKFTEQGEVGFNVTVVERTNEKSCIIKFEVSDTGIGIEEAKLNKIFESFTQADADTTRKYGGSGLGLTISKKLIELMGGKLKVQSQFGKGSNFSFNLEFECYEGDVYNGEVNNITDLDIFSNKKILVVEDNKINMIVATKILEKWGIEVKGAANGAIGLSMSQTEPFDLILIDMEMPVMDGITAVENIRKDDNQVPIIALTAASFDDMHQFLISKGMNDYVQKPFKPEELHQKISKHLRS